jgi:cystathionine beta-lyase/cystathionine gamma-synthase
MTSHLEKFGVATKWIDDSSISDLDKIKERFNSKTKILFLEFPSYFWFRHENLEPILAYAKSRNVITVLDNTFSGPQNFSYAHLFDIVVYSGTKMISGLGKDLIGFITTDSEHLKSILFKEGLMSLGAVLSPRLSDDLNKSLDSYRDRMNNCSAQAKTFLNELLKLSFIRKIHSPWIKNTNENVQSYREVAEFTYCVGLLSVEFKTDSEEKFENFCNQLKKFKLGVSYGSIEALFVPGLVFNRSHHDLQYPLGFARLSLGHCDPVDLIEDLKEASTHL